MGKRKLYIYYTIVLLLIRLSYLPKDLLSLTLFFMQIRKEALWACYAMAPGHEAMITVCYFP